MAKNYKYSGILGEPLKLTPLWLASLVEPRNDKLQQRAERHLEALNLELWNALLVDCGEQPIASTNELGRVNWMKVAYELARRHVPAFGPLAITFKESKKTGRPRKSTVDHDIELYGEVISRIEQGQTEQAAVRNARKALRRTESEVALGSRYRRTRDAIERGTRLLLRTVEHLLQK